MTFPGSKFFQRIQKKIINKYWNLYWKIQKTWLKFCGPIIDFFKKYYDFFAKYYFLVKNKIDSYFKFRQELRKKYRDISDENIKNSTQKCIEGAGGAKNIVDVTATLNTLKIKVDFKSFIDKDKFSECSSAGFSISGNLIEIITGFYEAQQICKNLQMSIGKKH